jgi:hypothetical protein
MEGRPIKSANDSYAITPKKPLVSQSANGRLSTYAVAPAVALDAPAAAPAVAPAAPKKDTYEVTDEVTDEYTKYFPEDKTQIAPGLQEVLDLDNKTDSITALNKYKKDNGITYGGKKSKKTKTKKSKTKKRKFRSTKKQNKKKNKRSHKKI